MNPVGLELLLAYFILLLRQTEKQMARTWLHQRTKHSRACSVTCLFVLLVRSARTCERNTNCVILLCVFCFYDSGICPVCKNNYSTRWRCYKHIADSRRTKCSERLVEVEYPQVSSSEYERLDDLHRAAVKIARREGRSQPIASGSARTAIGKAIGHVTR